MTIDQAFTLHSQLSKDCIIVGSFQFNIVLLVNDKHYPWFILVPQKSNIKEIYQLSQQEQQRLLAESSRFSKAIQSIFNADKLNIAALGNMVPQLHIHHIVRYQSDKAWPGPIWGVEPAQEYTQTEIAQVIAQLKTASIAGLQFKD